MYKHILIPVAPGHSDECSASLEAAHRLLAKEGQISVLSILEELPSYIGSYFPPEQVEEAKVEIADEIESEMGLDSVKVDVVSGHPTSSILSWADNHNVDCIVVSSHRPGLSDLLLGSTAARVVRHAQCSVVVLR